MFLEERELGAYMPCTAIPHKARREFGHTCEHGPQPHRIHVLVLREPAYAKLYDSLAKLAS